MVRPAGQKTRDLLSIVATIAEGKAGFLSLKDAWADTGSASGRLMLTVLGGLAEFERESLRCPYRRRQEARTSPWRAFRSTGPSSTSTSDEALQRLAQGRRTRTGAGLTMSRRLPFRGCRMERRARCLPSSGNELTPSFSPYQGQAFTATMCFLRHEGH